MNTKFLFSISLFIIGYQQLYAQNSMGVGTETPNANAVLELVSPNNNQGFLVPRLTTAQRTDANFTDNLSTSENGLLVYDSDDDQFYFWAGGAWNAVGNQTTLLDNDSLNELQDISLSGSSLTISDGSTIDLSSLGYVTTSDDADADPANELQDITLAGTSLSIAGGSTIDLSVIDTDSVLSDATITSLGYLKNADDADADPVNEIQDISLAGTSLTLSSGSTIDLSTIDTDTQLSDAEITALGYIKNPNDADADVTNEIQDLSLSGTTLTITNNPSATAIDLSPFSGTNTDNQDLTLSGNTLSLSNDGTPVDLSGFLDNTDSQNLSITGTSLAISGGNSIDLAAVDTDTQLTDAEITALGFIKSADLSGLQNEINDTQSGSGLNTDGTFPGNTGTNYLDAATSLLDADNLLDTQVGINTTDIATNTIDIAANTTAIAADADTDATNEYQDLQFVNGIVTLSNDPSPSSIDLRTYDSDNTDDFSGSWNDLTDIPADIANGDQVNDADASSTNELQTISKSGSTVTLSNGGGSFTDATGPSGRTDFKYIGAPEFSEYADAQTAGLNGTVTRGSTGDYGFIQLDVVESTGKIAAPFEVPNGSTVDQVIITASNVKGIAAQIEIISFPFGAAAIQESSVPKPLDGGSIVIDKGLSDYELLPGVQVDNTTNQYLIIATVGSGTTLNIYQIRVRYSFSY